MKKGFKITVLAVLMLSLLLAAVPAFAENDAGEKDSSILFFWPLDNGFDDVISGLNFYSESEDFTDGAYSGSTAWDSTYGGFGYTDPVNVESKNFTVVCWFYAPGDSKLPWNALFSSSLLNSEDFVELYFSNNTNNDGLILRGSVGDQLDMCIATDFEADKWHQAALTYDDATKTLKGYIDGQLGAERNVSGGNFTGINGAVLYLGHEKTNYVFGYQYIDDLMFANRVFSDEEINAMYADPAGFAAKYLPEPTATPEATATPEPTKEATPAPATNPPATEALATGANDKPTVVPSTPGEKTSDDNKTNPVPFIIAAVAVAAVVAAVVIIAVRKKKKG